MKTLGRYFPEQLTPWLAEQLQENKPRALLIRKAVTYLPENLCGKVLRVRDK